MDANRQLLLAKHTVPVPPAEDDGVLVTLELDVPFPENQQVG